MKVSSSNVPISFVEDNIQNVLQHLAGFFDGQIRIEVPDKVRKSHHQVVKDVRTNVDAGNNFLLEQKKLE